MFRLLAVLQKWRLTVSIQMALDKNKAFSFRFSLVSSHGDKDVKRAHLAREFTISFNRATTTGMTAHIHIVEQDCKRQ